VTIFRPMCVLSIDQVFVSPDNQRSGPLAPFPERRVEVEIRDVLHGVPIFRGLRGTRDEMGRKSRQSTPPFSDPATTCDDHQSSLRKCRSHRTSGVQRPMLDEHQPWSRQPRLQWNAAQIVLFCVCVAPRKQADRVRLRDGKFQGEKLHFLTRAEPCPQPNLQFDVCDCKWKARRLLHNHLVAAGAGQGNGRPGAKLNCRGLESASRLRSLVYRASRLGNPGQASAMPRPSATAHACREGKLFSRFIQPRIRATASIQYPA
jgi:hypothetical protein